ncbi:MAG TPA: AmmeMemoRadiSam system protein B [Acidobacteriota bacterium]|nr:AmmeMemoRadiSam system protein B [Acidobacteriota bacterium]
MEQDGKTLIYLKDPLNFATPLGISPVGYFVLSHFDGDHSFLDIQEAYCKRFGALLVTDELKQFVDMLDQYYYLDSERFSDYRQLVIAEFRQLPKRASAHVGGVYKSNPAELTAQLDGYFTSHKGPGLPSTNGLGATPRAIVAPHIDFHRGGPAYAWAYKGLAESAGADLYIILGTSHCGGQTPYILTLKDFDTPLGVVDTDRQFVGRLQSQCADDCFVDEYLHRGEHSIEFQVLFLKYVAQKRAALTGEVEKPFKIVPILVSSFHSLMMRRTLPEQTPEVGGFLTTLRRLAAAEVRQVCFVAGVDLAHVGRQFGDQEPVTEDFLNWVETEDRKLVDRLIELDAPGFFNEIAKDQDKRKICGFAPLYSLIHLLDSTRGNHLHYSQAFTPETRSAVTFTSVVFE